MDCVAGSPHHEVMNALEVVLTVLGSFVTLNVIAWRWGVDTREPGEWQWREPQGRAR